MIIIENALLEFFQKISDWTQKCFNLDNFFLARLSLIISGLFVVLREIHLHFYDKNKIDSVGVVATLISLSILIFILMCVKSIESCIKNNPNSVQVSTYATVLLAGFRKVSVLFFLLSIPTSVLYFFNLMHGEKHRFYSEIFYQLYGISRLIAIFFASCTPKPPGPSRLRKFVENVIQFITLKRAFA